MVSIELARALADADEGVDPQGAYNREHTCYACIHFVFTSNGELLCANQGSNNVPYPITPMYGCEMVEYENSEGRRPDW